jgi:TctA family transporter
LLHSYHVLGFLNTPEYAKRDYARHEAPMAIITTSLFIAVIYRQAWARYLLLALLLFRLGSTLIFVPMQTEAMLQNPAMAIDVLFYPALAGCIIWGIKSIPSIRRLVSRTYE